MQYLIGIDEAGRGPLAGPVSVGVVVVPAGFDWSLVAGARDSKMMTEKSRERLFAILTALKDEKQLDFAVGFSSAAMIDRVGVVSSVSAAMDDAFRHIVFEPDPSAETYARCRVLLDGGLRAPERFVDQTTIIRGDQSEPVISLASIAAKVSRDRLMVELAPSYPAYAFEKHKGYGTPAHRTAIAEYGLSDVHRASFCSHINRRVSP